MRFKLLTIVLPYDTVTLARGLRYSTLSVSKEETDNTDGVRFISRKVEPNPSGMGPPVVHTLKDFYLDKRIPSFYRKFLPSSSLVISEECWSTELIATGEKAVIEEMKKDEHLETLPPLTDQRVQTTYHSDYFKKLRIEVKSVIARANVGNTLTGDTTTTTIKNLYGDIDGLEKKGVEICDEFVDLSGGFGEGRVYSVVFKLIMVDFPYALSGMCESYIVKKIAGVMKNVHRTVVSDEETWKGMTDEELDKMEGDLMRSGLYRTDKQVVDDAKEGEVASHPPSATATKQQTQVPLPPSGTRNTETQPTAALASNIRPPSSDTPKWPPITNISAPAESGIGTAAHTQPQLTQYAQQGYAGHAVGVQSHHPRRVAKGVESWATGPGGY